MNKIFNKLKLILTITVIFISLLFGILLCRQYIQFNNSSKSLSASSISLLERDIHMILDFNERIAHTYYEESFKNNSELKQIISSYTHPVDKPNPEYLSELESQLNPIFNNAKENLFSYIKILDTEGHPIQSVYDTPTLRETNYHYTYPLYTEDFDIGYVELGLSVQAITKTLQEARNQAVYAVFKKTDITSASLKNYSDEYIPSNLSDLYYVDIKMMDNLYSYSTNYEEIIFSTFTTSIRSIVYEDLLKNKSFELHRSFDSKYYSLIFVPLDNNVNLEKGYFVLFEENVPLTTLRDNLIISIGLLIGLYLTLLFIVIFIYYILNYLYHFSYTDHLTKTYNRHKFFDVIKRIIYDYHRYNYMFSVILIDIDNFKTINDTLGHNIGDEVLIQFVDIIKTSLRTTDYVFRWGGEEFLVLLPHCDAKIALQVSEKLRENIDAYDFKLKTKTNVTASFGVASYNNSTNIEHMISHADKALYASKARGKNCSTLYRSDLD